MSPIQASREAADARRPIHPKSRTRACPMPAPRFLSTSGPSPPSPGLVTCHPPSAALASP